MNPDQHLGYNDYLMIITTFPFRTPTVLVPLLQDFFPYMSKSPYIHECYMKNLLQVTTYLPSHRAPILELIIDRMTKIGVGIFLNSILNSDLVPYLSSGFPIIPWDCVQSGSSGDSLVIAVCPQGCVDERCDSVVQ